MPLNIKNAQVEHLIDEIVGLTGETKTAAVLRALEERRARLQLGGGSRREARLRRFLETEVWPSLPASRRPRLTRDEEDALLGYGPEGV